MVWLLLGRVSNCIAVCKLTLLQLMLLTPLLLFSKALLLHHDMLLLLLLSQVQAADLTCRLERGPQHIEQVATDDLSDCRPLGSIWMNQSHQKGSLVRTMLLHEAWGQNTPPHVLQYCNTQLRVLDGVDQLKEEHAKGEDI